MMMETQQRNVNMQHMEAMITMASGSALSLKWWKLWEVNGRGNSGFRSKIGGG